MVLRYLVSTVSYHTVYNTLNINMHEQVVTQLWNQICNAVTAQLKYGDLEMS